MPAVECGPRGSRSGNNFKRSPRCVGQRTSAIQGVGTRSVAEPQRSLATGEQDRYLLTMIGTASTLTHVARRGFASSARAAGANVRSSHAHRLERCSCGRALWMLPGDVC